MVCHCCLSICLSVCRSSCLSLFLSCPADLGWPIQGPTKSNPNQLFSILVKGSLVVTICCWQLNLVCDTENICIIGLILEEDHGVSSAHLLKRNLQEKSTGMYSMNTFMGFGAFTFQFLNYFFYFIVPLYLSFPKALSFQTLLLKCLCKPSWETSVLKSSIYFPSSYKINQYMK